MSRPLTQQQKHLRREVERIAGVVAGERQVSLDDLLGTSRSPAAIEARHEAMRLIMAVTGCSQSELAWAWGCGFATVHRAISDKPRSVPAPKQPLRSSAYDAATIARLTARHGAQRTLDIINGRDAATNADVAAWSRIGAAL